MPNSSDAPARTPEAAPATPQKAARVPVRGIAVWLLACIAAMAAFTAWSASPPGSSPDDDYHLASIWCANGEAAKQCEAIEGEPESRAVPKLASGVAPCFARNNTISGSCQDGMAADAADVGTPHGNWNGAYPPYFYKFHGLFIGKDVEKSVITMRIANAGLIVGLLGLLAAALPRRRRPLAAVPLLLTSIPLAMSLIPSTNPSSWAIAGAAAVWPALYVAFETKGRRQWALTAVALLAAFIGSGSRADGCLFVVMSIGLVLILRVRHVRGNLIPLLGAVAGVAIAATIFLSAGHASAVSEGLGYSMKALTSTQIFMINLSSLPTLWFGIFGSGHLGGTGWLDTIYPPMVTTIATGVWFGVVLGGIKRMFPAKFVGSALIATALVVYPMFLLMKAHVLVGEGVQPRYLLPMIVILTGLLLLGHDAVVPRFTRTAYAVVTLALGLAHMVALHIHIRRYSTGLDVSKTLFGDDLEWWWGIGPSATLTWLIGSAGFVVVTAVVLWPMLGVRDRDRESAPAGSDADRSSEPQPRSA